MGVKHLWNIIEKTGDEVSDFEEFRRKKIAVDLNMWVVPCSAVAEQGKLDRIFYKTIALLKVGATPVFILEGQVPNIKRQKSRQYFRDDNNCVQMLRLMGCPIFRAAGQAENMCAFLNAKGLVAGCITNDSDCFLYGAKTVYKNFKVDRYKRGGGSAMKYTMEKIQNVSKLERNKMIALALLAGCDYDRGVKTVGIKTAMKLLEVADEDEEDILVRMRRWRDKDFMCTYCGHRGSVEEHARSGCRGCGNESRCNKPSKAKKKLLNNEMAVRNLAIQKKTFPRETVITEFLHERDTAPAARSIKWSRPDIKKFKTFMSQNTELDNPTIIKFAHELRSAWIQKA